MASSPPSGRTQPTAAPSPLGDRRAAGGPSRPGAVRRTARARSVGIGFAGRRVGRSRGHCPPIRGSAARRRPQRRRAALLGAVGRGVECVAAPLLPSRERLRQSRAERPDGGSHLDTKARGDRLGVLAHILPRATRGRVIRDEPTHRPPAPHGPAVYKRATFGATTRPRPARAATARDAARLRGTTRTRRVVLEPGRAASGGARGRDRGLQPSSPVPPAFDRRVRARGVARPRFTRLAA